MIHVNTDTLEESIPSDWVAKAQKALEYVRRQRSKPQNGQTAAEAQAAALKKRQKVWGELKAVLSKLSNGKCWYCESRAVRSYNDVDHFRPKNGVAECPSHDGYWWLAFSPDNLRYSCEKCNRPRKGVHFPLENEDRRCRCDADHIAAESPILLDPTRPTEPGSLAFYPGGEVQPATNMVENPVAHLRAEVSIDLYFLRDADLVEARARAFDAVREAIADIDFYSAAVVRGDSSALPRLKTKLRKLRSITGPRAEFSAASRAALVEYETPLVSRLVAAGVL